jgi:class 3 adenylate cyclase
LSNRLRYRTRDAARDGFLGEVASVVDAVACAIGLQREVAVRNASVPEAQRFVFRVGLNLGAVIIDGEDIHGDGVTIASRLEGLAEPGGICVSHPVYQSVKDKLELGLDNIGESLVENIETPVKIDRVRLDGRSAATRRSPRARRLCLEHFWFKRHHRPAPPPGHPRQYHWGGRVGVRAGAIPRQWKRL